MTDAQKQTYGDSMDPDYLNPYMWVWKPHYYSTGLSFYNFPYAFGLLFAKGLYGVYQQEGEAFTSKYDDLLKATVKMDVEDVALLAGIDVTKKEFWTTSRSNQRRYRFILNINKIIQFVCKRTIIIL